MLTRHVDVTYIITGPTHPPVAHRVRWSAAERLERIDGSKRSTSIFKQGDNEVTLLNGPNHAYLKLEGALANR